MRTFYNEIDSGKCEWLRQLQRRQVIGRGKIESTTITSLIAGDVAGFGWCHFFAGIGIWDYALRLAGWPKDREVWTGSCPCQPFSVAGKGKGTADERHLWPAWFRLISERRPVTIFGEQVSDGDGQTWLDIVQADLESVGYRIGSVTLPAAGFGAPHGRHRIFFVADTVSNRKERTGRDKFVFDARCATGDLADAAEFGHDGRRTGEAGNRGRNEQESERLRTSGLAVGNAEQAGLEGHRGDGDGGHKSRRQRTQSAGSVAEAGATGGMDNATIARRDGEGQGSEIETRDEARMCGPERGRGPCSGFWSDAQWLPCTDGKARAVEPGTFPLAHGAPARVLRLRGYGDAICAPAAAEFIKAYLTVSQQPNIER